MQKTFGKKGLYQNILEENGQNILDSICPDELQQKLPLIYEELLKLPDAEKMRETLNAAGCVTTMAEIGLPDSLKDLTLQLCPYVRRRLTLLRLSKMLEYPDEIL